MHNGPPRTCVNSGFAAGDFYSLNLVYPPMPEPINRKRNLFRVMLIIAAAFLIVLVLGKYNVFTIWRFQQQKTELENKVQALKIENQRLTDQIEALKNDPQVIEKIAREKFGMVGRDEVIYRILADSNDTISSDSLDNAP